MQSKEPLQIFTHVYELYPHIPQYDLECKTIQKYEYLLQRFTQLYGCQPTYYVKSPGRLSLFGQPSQGYSTLEMCIPRDVMVMVAVNSRPEIRINHYDKTVKPEKKFPVDLQTNKFDTQQKPDDYHNMLVMAMKTCAVLARKEQFVSVGMDIFIHSDFLGRCKLSQTTALIYGLIYGLLAANKLTGNVKKQQIYQQIHKWKSTFSTLVPNPTQLHAKNHKLLLVPSKQHLQFPKGYTMILANSLTPEPIKLTEGRRQNLRMCQILLGMEIIISELGISKSFSNMRQLQENLGYSTEDMIDCVEQSVPNRVLEAQQIEKMTDRQLIDILRLVPYANVVIEQNKQFNPFRRMMFLLKEEQIMEKCRQLLISNRPDEQKCQQFGRLLNESHKLGRENLEIESKEIDRLIGVAKNVGIVYHKLVGNGWGGNVVFYVEQKKVDAYIDSLVKDYYLAKENQIFISTEYDEYVYEVQPSLATSILDPQYELWF